MFEGGAAAVESRTERTHSDNGHTVSPLAHLGQCRVPVKMISHPTQNRARSNKI